MCDLEKILQRSSPLFSIKVPNLEKLFQNVYINSHNGNMQGNFALKSCGEDGKKFGVL